MDKLILGIEISVWIAFIALFISAFSLILSIRSYRFNRKLEATKIRTNLIQRVLLTNETYRKLGRIIDDFVESCDGVPNPETDDYRKIVKEAVDITKMIYELAEKDKVVDPVKLERWVSRVEALYTGAERRIREVTTSIEIPREKGNKDRA